MTSTTRLFRKGLMCAASLSGFAFTTGAYAQVVERHLPPSRTAEATPIMAPNAVPADQDATPIGPALRAIVVLGPEDTVRRDSISDGIDLSAVGRLQADTDKTRAALKPYLGQPLSKKLIAEIQAAIAGRYRALSYPFVSLSTPPQEIGGGALQVRVVEFRSGAISTQGASETEGEQIVKRVRLKPGNAINARELSTDLSWVNRYPFRRVQGVFKPGQSYATSDLVIDTSKGREWQVYGGYNNSGSPATGTARYYAGTVVGLGGDSVLAYQATGSSDVFRKYGKYASQALSLTVPAGPRRQVEASLNQVRSNQTLQPFRVAQNTVEASLGLRFAVPGYNKDNALTDLRFGIESKRQGAKTYFGGIGVYDAAMNVHQLYLGYHRNAQSARVLSDLDVNLRFSPGGLNDGNSAAAVNQFSQGRLKNAKYHYLSVAFDRKALVGKTSTWRTQMIGMVSTRSLPRTEQMGLGGPYLVRGYTLDDGAFDDAVVMRNELQFKPLNPATAGASVRPYTFIDVGYGHDKYTKKDARLASAGLGAHIQVARHVALSVDAARTLKKGPATPAGDWRANASLNFSF